MKKLFAIAALAATLALAGCATTGGGSPGGPVQVVLDKSETAGTHVRAMLPLGNESLDAGGMDHIAAVVAQIPGVTKVEIFDYYQTQTAADEISAEPASVKEVIIGFSCGANASPVVAAGTTRRVYVFVIQVSEWCGGVPLGANVVRAQETYNPNCLDTGGLGCGRLVPGVGFNPSNLTFIERPDCHTCSDHDPDAVNDIVLAVKSVTSAPAAQRFGARFGKRVPGAINVITRYHGQTAY